MEQHGLKIAESPAQQIEEMEPLTGGEANMEVLKRREKPKNEIVPEEISDAGPEKIPTLKKNVWKLLKVVFKLIFCDFRPILKIQKI